MIPKAIHQIWIGNPNLRPAELMATWEMPSWHYTLWTEREIDAFGLKNRRLYDFYLGKKDYAGASDVARVEILLNKGGFYIDADTRRLESINELRNCNFTAVQANSNVGVIAGTTRVANGVIGAISNHKILANYVTAMGLLPIPSMVVPPWSTIGGTLFSYCIQDYQPTSKKDVVILPPHTFYPFDSKGNKATTTGTTYAEHLWGSTHKSYGKL